MTVSSLARQAAWLWLPVFLGLCLAIGTYRTASADEPGACSSPSSMQRFLHCP